MLKLLHFYNNKANESETHRKRILLKSENLNNKFFCFFIFYRYCEIFIFIVQFKLFLLFNYEKIEINLPLFLL